MLARALVMFCAIEWARSPWGPSSSRCPTTQISWPSGTAPPPSRTVGPRSFFHGSTVAAHHFLRQIQKRAKKSRTATTLRAATAQVLHRRLFQVNFQYAP
ncbi:hypothetical protein RHSIM_Rhsim03G0041000 [Rhododendron simsii]|uniref:Uncharacterized protein n=1 Tax=Rhododendron simsii TaxID=118357 RepID=A0A834H6A9_RHOSS|nr:hypothetical protein RHSIM_Rhsim03G0041000 [Rhododendron simsii]